MIKPASESQPSALEQTRTQRMILFVVTLALLNLPLLIIGLIDLRSSPVTLILTLITYGYYALYYALVRRGYGVPATYGCVTLLAVLIGAGVHNGGGFLLALNSLYALLLVAVGLVLDDARALDFTLLICVLCYGAVAAIELALQPPLVFAGLYETNNRLAVTASVVTMLVTLAGIWRLMRANLLMMRRTTAEIERARRSAEDRARENATLVAEAESGNRQLRATEARLRATVDALALPLIPLENGIALLPLVGYVDQARGERLIGALLDGIHSQRVRGVVIDITGLRDVDERVAATLLRGAQAARLLGASVVLSGVGAETAQALVSLHTSMDAIETTGNLHDALVRLARV